VPLVATEVHNSGLLKGSDILDVIRGTQTFECYCFITTILAI